VQYAARDYVEKLLARGVSISIAAVGKPEENSFAERLIVRAKIHIPTVSGGVAQCHHGLTRCFVETVRWGLDSGGEAWRREPILR